MGTSQYCPETVCLAVISYPMRVYFGTNSHYYTITYSSPLWLLHCHILLSTVLYSSVVLTSSIPGHVTPQRTKFSIPIYNIFNLLFCGSHTQCDFLVGVPHMFLLVSTSALLSVGALWACHKLLIDILYRQLIYNCLYMRASQAFNLTSNLIVNVQFRFT